MDQSPWKRLIAQVAIWAVIFQAAFGVFGCGPTMSHVGPRNLAPQIFGSQVFGYLASQGYGFSGKGPVSQAAVICTAKSFKRATTNGGAPTGGSDDTPQHDCPVCLLIAAIQATQRRRRRFSFPLCPLCRRSWPLKPASPCRAPSCTPSAIAIPPPPSSSEQVLSLIIICCVYARAFPPGIGLRTREFRPGSARTTRTAWGHWRARLREVGLCSQPPAAKICFPTSA